MDQHLRSIIEGVSNTRGADFFSSITLSLAKVVGATYTFVARLDIDRYVSETIALVANGKLVDNIEYSLEHTPCANVADNAVCLYPKNVTHLFPQDQLLIDMNIEAYLGTPLIGARGNVIGIIVALYATPLINAEQTQTLFEIFSGRIAAELERVEYEKQLLSLNATLEQKVAERTADLNTTLNQLQKTQDQLIESEKIASLGNLVASIAHEVNTPLGVAITGQSLLQDSFNQLVLALQTQQLSKSQMSNFVQLFSEALPLVSDNLQRAKNLINNFKKTAVDQHSDVKENINLNDYFQQVLATLTPLLKQNGVGSEVHIAPDIEVDTFPGAHAQILTNLITNSITHGFKGQDHKRICLYARRQNNAIIITYQDNGIGLTTDCREHIFEPFYTTARARGGTGLGMSIVYNLVRQKLAGELTLLPSEPGFGIEITMPV
ncbi:ATP-binding protein [Reinekea sp. G2M2-21]|uniref:ATP-binding protein n=1 Tax=Reinekea sp. G2M2-21 TaxID=2788942 RepID=UPI0018A90C44|nr:ATP-binding protein [Reinekea sp. G2M2-21]